MVDENAPKPGNDPNQPHSFYQNFQHTPVGARVPEKVGRGVFSSAVMILQTGDLFVLDFLSIMVQPQQVVARVVMTASSFSQFLVALRANVSKYEQHLGPLLAHSPPGQTPAAGQVPPSPGAHPAQPFSSTAAVASASAGEQSAPAKPAPGQVNVADVYQDLKFPDDLLGGVFANAVMIRHTPEEFCFDFISNLFPRPAVVSRVFAAAGRIPSLLETMGGSLGRYQHGGAHPPPPPPPSPPPFE
jgi:hypothetical protein